MVEGKESEIEGGFKEKKHGRGRGRGRIILKRNGSGRRSEGESKK